MSSPNFRRRAAILGAVVGSCRGIHVGVATASLPAVVAAQPVAPSWPARPLRLVVPFAPGGGADSLARPLAEHLREALGQSVLVENRSGASSNIGTAEVARAAPDGYSLLINTDGVAIYNDLYAKLDYDFFRDFTPVAYVASSPLLLAVHPAVAAADLRGFVDLARRDGAKLTFANPGPGSPHHLAYELLSREAGFRTGEAIYRGGGQAVTDVIAGHVQIGMFTLGAVWQHVQAGRLRPLAVLTRQRSDLASDLPTVVESGWPQVHVALRFVVVAPAATPRVIVDRLSGAIATAVAKPDYRAMLRAQGYEPFATTPDEAAGLLADERRRWAPLLKQAGIRLE